MILGCKLPRLFGGATVAGKSLYSDRARTILYRGVSSKSGAYINHEDLKHLPVPSPLARRGREPHINLRSCSTLAW